MLVVVRSESLMLHVLLFEEISSQSQTAKHVLVVQFTADKNRFARNNLMRF